jgi:hypothetical protein
MKTIQFDNIPPEVILEILLFIHDDDKSWMNVALSNKHLQSICYDYRYKEMQVTKDNKQVTHVFYQGAPVEYYITLRKTNFSRYQVPRRSLINDNGSHVHTIWYKIRVDPVTLMVNNGDFKYSSSTGYYNHHQGHESHVPFGTCFDCENPYSTTGSAVIDLRGTCFAVQNSFTHAGYLSAGNWSYTHNDQVVSLKGGGYCGWSCPELADTESKAAAGGWFIELKIVDQTISVDTTATNDLDFFTSDR